MNQIREVLQTRIDNLIRLAEVAGTVAHSSTIGDLRETYIRDFFRELIPASVSLSSGFVGDAIGNISPQLDFIVTQKSALPVISMKDQLSIVPVESALVAEIKSSLSTTHLEQVQKQNESLASLKISCEIGSERFIIPTIILAYESNVANETLKEWMRGNGNTVACCVLNGDTFLKDGNVRIFEKNAFDIRHHGVLAFIANFYGMLTHLNEQRGISPNFHVYLTGRPKKDKSSS